MGEHDNFTLGVDAASRFVVTVTTLGSILPIFDIPFHQFLTSISLVAVAMVILFKEYIANFLDGFRLMFSHDFWVGDYIKVNDSARGVIRSITFHSTKLKTDDGNILFIPNTQLINGAVVNFSKLKLKRITVPFTVATKQLQPLEDFEAMLVSTLVAEFGEQINPEKVFLRITALEEEKTECTLEVSVDHYSFKFEDRITKFVYQQVIERTMKEDDA